MPLDLFRAGDISLEISLSDVAPTAAQWLNTRQLPINISQFYRAQPPYGTRTVSCHESFHENKGSAYVIPARPDERTAYYRTDTHAGSARAELIPVHLHTQHYIVYTLLWAVSLGHPFFTISAHKPLYRATPIPYWRAHWPGYCCAYSKYASSAGCIIVSATVRPQHTQYLISLDNASEE